MGRANEPKDGLPPELAKVLQDIAVKDDSTEHIVVCGATYDAIHQEVVVKIRTKVGHVHVLELGPPSNLTVKRFGRDITPSHFDRLQRKIARAIDDRAGRPIVEQVRIMEVHYKCIIPDDDRPPAARR
jgi:hypothetical protein